VISLFAGTLFYCTIFLFLLCCYIWWFLGDYDFSGAYSLLFVFFCWLVESVIVFLVCYLVYRLLFPGAHTLEFILLYEFVFFNCIMLILSFYSLFNLTYIILLYLLILGSFELVIFCSLLFI